MKALFLGLGGVGQRHMRNLLQIMPGVTLGAVRHGNRTFEIGHDLQPDYSVDIMEKYNIARLASVDKAITWKPDFAVIASPTSAHMKQTTALVKAGVPVFLEKPISANEDGLDELTTLVKQTGSPVMVGYMFRFHPGVQRFMGLVSDQATGRPHTMHIQLNSYMPSWHNYEKYNEFYAGRKDLGGGAVLSEIHELDLLTAMLGVPKTIYSTGGKLSSLNLDVEDTACALMEFAIDGRPLPVTLQMSFIQRPPTRAITLYAERGTIRWEGMSSTVTIDDVDEGLKVENFSDFDRNQMFVDELQHFITCLQNKKTPLTNLPNVLAGHQLALKIRKKMA